MAKRRNFHDDMNAVEYLVKKVDKLTTWEADFIDSIHNRLESGRPLTESQGDALDGIWEAVVVRGIR